ncbi:MAG: glycoside hydrolase family 15 protein, partial [Nanoarchaeota archaeon]|nr:glycoside hydrolase family 15 protein [Nanoarchaeota archaeon]
MLDYGIIGNCVTCALIKKNASIDWMCFPTFSSLSIFAKLLDENKGGSLEIKPIGNYEIIQRYLPNTAILETTFSSAKNVFVVYDFFPRYKKLTKKKYEKLIKLNNLIRIIKPLKGKPKIRIKYCPKPNYALEESNLVEKNETIVCSFLGQKIVFNSNISYDDIIHSKEILLDKAKYLALGEENDFSLRRCYKLLQATKKYWQEWCKTLVVPKKNKEVIVRSAITLKLLTYSRTGAVIAAATTSVPEEIGTDRTFDYRYCWVRDAALCVDALKKIGRNYEPKKLMEFIITLALKNDYLQIMYGIEGEISLDERSLNHLDGFKGSKPIRIGNAAFNQAQHDIYGEILDIIYLYFVYYEYEKKLTKKYWRFICYVVNQIKSNWEKPDSGIWEFRGQYKHYVYSKLMCYVGVDRAILIAKHYNKDEKIIQEWMELKENIKKEILEKGYNDNVKSFTMYYGSENLDASLLQMTYHEFLKNDDLQLIDTVKNIYKHLCDGYLVQRYKIKDDFGKSKSAFTICSFWLIDALYYIGEEKKARNLYQRLIKKA